jgi:hypothetical protein
MTLALSSRTKLRMSLAIAVLAVVGSAALSTPASAAKQSTVVAACKRTAGCVIITGSGGGVSGCSPHACFTCSNGKCTKVPDRIVGKPNLGPKTTIGNASLTKRVTANDTVVHRGSTAPVQFAAPGNNHMRMGGRH